MIRLFTLILISVLLLKCENVIAQEVNVTKAKYYPVSEYRQCYNGVGFFQVDKEQLGSRLPKTFSPRDGSILGSLYEGYALLAIIYYSCPQPDSTNKTWSLIATPIENPSAASGLSHVRWNWYEFARLVETADRVDSLSKLGFTVRRAKLFHSQFNEVNRKARFAAHIGGNTVFNVEASLTDTVNFNAQSHRFWHQSSNDRTLSTRLNFEYHHSWLGGFKHCEMDTDELNLEIIRGIECTGVGVTEAIESLTFDEHVIIWN